MEKKESAIYFVNHQNSSYSLSVIVFKDAKERFGRNETHFWRSRCVVYVGGW